MKHYKKQLLLVALALLTSTIGIAQQNPNTHTTYPEVGKACPDFHFTEVVNGSSKTLSLQDLKGQHFILDFWSRWCAACVSSFPTMNDYQEGFKGKLKVILVGLDDNAIRPLFESVKRRYKLQLTCAFDSLTHQSFGVSSVPHLVWVGADGIVKAVTATEPVNHENLDHFVNDLSLNLPQKLNALQAAQSRAAYHADQPFLMNGNGGIDTAFLYRSILTKWTKTMPVVVKHQFATRHKKPNEVLVLGTPLAYLYKMAYNGDSLINTPTFNHQPNSYGHFWFEPILELADTSLFRYRYEYEENLFCYNLTVNTGGVNRSVLQQHMQRDLENYFGFKVRIETRKMPFWKLVTLPGYEKLKTKGGKPLVAGDGLSSLIYRNVPASLLINAFWSKNQQGAPFVDETGLPWNIDLDIHAMTTDFADFKKALNRNHLDLVSDEQDTQVIIISDAGTAKGQSRIGSGTGPELQKHVD